MILPTLLGSVLNLDLFVSTVRENKGMGLLPDSEERLQHAVSDTHHDTPPTLDADCGSLDPPAATLKEFFWALFDAQVNAGTAGMSPPAISLDHSNKT